MGEIYAEDYERIPCEKNGYYQSDFVVSKDNLKTRITIFATQPIYCENGNFDLVPLRIREQLCYPAFEIREIIFHDLRDDGLSKKITQILGSLANV